MLIEYLPAESAVVRAYAGHEAVEWDLHANLLAAIADAVQQGNWQRAGNRNAPRPKRIPRPGLAGGDEPKRFGTAKHTVSEMRLILDTWSVEAS